MTSSDNLLRGVRNRLLGNMSRIRQLETQNGMLLVSHNKLPSRFQIGDEVMALDADGEWVGPLPVVGVHFAGGPGMLAKVHYDFGNGRDNIDSCDVRPVAAAEKKTVSEETV